MAKKAKAKVFCQCGEPRILVDGNGQPYSAEPLCRKADGGCGYPVKRIPPGIRNPGGPGIQQRWQGQPWAGPGPCPRPPETETDAYRRGYQWAADPTSVPDFVVPRSTPVSAPQRSEAARRAALAQLKLLRPHPAFTETTGDSPHA